MLYTHSHSKCTLLAPESAKAYLAKAEFSINRKEKIWAALVNYVDVRLFQRSLSGAWNGIES